MAQSRNAQPNYQLRRAREGLSLSQEQVADLVADDVERRTGRRPPIDADQVGRYERGLHSWPGKDYRLAFRVVFGVGTDAELGFHSGRSRSPSIGEAETPTLAGRTATPTSRLPSGINPVDRRHFLLGLGALGVEVAAGARVGSGEVKQLRQALVSFRKLDNRVGGDRLHESAAVHLRDMSRLINTCRFSESTGRKLRAATADLAVFTGWLAFDFTGWLAFDADRHVVAWYYYNEGLTAARLAGSDEIEIHALAQMSLLAGNVGRPRDSVELAQEARRIAERAHMAPRLRSLLSMREAHGWSELDEVTAARRALTQARKLFEHGAREHDPTWIGFYDQAELDGLTAACLARLADYRSAADLTAATLTQLDPQYVRNRAYYTVTHAEACAAANRPDEAAASGVQALGLLSEVSSARTLGHLRSLQRRLTARHPRLAAVRDFDVRYRLSGIA